MHPADVLYASERSRLLEQLRTLTPQQASTLVPACPEWSVKDVVAHLSGLVAETLDDVPPPRGSDVATARQVADRSDLDLASVLDEWESNSSAFDALASTDLDYTAALMADLVVHGHDIAEALSLPIEKTSAATMAAADRYFGRLQDRAAEHFDIALDAELSGLGSRASRAGSRPVNLVAQPFELLRCMTGRRDQAAVGALQWSGDASALIPYVNLYGPDVPQP